MSTTTEEKTDALIMDPAQLHKQILAWQAEGCHVLTPATRIQRFAPNWGASVSHVVLDSTVNDNGRGTDVYFDPSTMKKDLGERGISKIGLDKIIRCAGISWDPNLSARVDPRTAIHLWEFRAVGVGLDFDGMPFTITGTREIDLRDGSAQIGGWSPELWQAEIEKAKRERRELKSINGWSDRRVLAARAHGLQLCETKAKDRAGRTLGLSHIYTVKQLQKPFIVVKATYMPDMNDAETRSMVTEQALRGTRAMFAPQVTRATVLDITPREYREPPRALPAAREPDTTREDIARAETREPIPFRPPAVSAPEPVAARAPEPSPEPRDDDSRPHEESSDRQPGRREQPSQNEEGTRWGAGVTGIRTMKTGATKKGDWTLVRITLDVDGTEQSFTTLDSGLVDQARTLLDSRGIADVLVQKNDAGYMGIVSITPVGDDREEETAAASTEGLEPLTADDIPF